MNNPAVVVLSAAPRHDAKALLKRRRSAWHWVAYGGAMVMNLSFLRHTHEQWAIRAGRDVVLNGDLLTVTGLLGGCLIAYGFARSICVSQAAVVRPRQLLGDYDVLDLQGLKRYRDF